MDWTDTAILVVAGFLLWRASDPARTSCQKRSDYTLGTLALLAAGAKWYVQHTVRMTSISSY